MSDAGRFDFAVAVVGMAGRFPGARNVAEFWQNICEGVESVSFFSEEELRARGVDAAALGGGGYVRAEAVLEEIELFDAAFFGFTPREAELTDPQHRLFLEHAWEALESAGYDAGKFAGRIGVYAGESPNTYLLHNLYPHRELLAAVGVSQTIIGNDRDYLATQVAYKLNLKGPAISVQTACSTSLVAVHLACQSLLNRECDMALAGGASVAVPHGHGAHFSEGGIISPDGHCRAFDAGARGTVKASGVGVVVLKRMADALEDGDQIHAVVKGTAINNDGAGKVGFTAPGVGGQATVIEEALAMAAVEPETIGYVEAHGTGTALGDPVEIAALTRAFRASTSAKGFCAVGSVKTNVGHADAAAGVAGFIKTVLALEHRLLPPSLHFERPNPHIDFAASPFYVNTKLSEWKTNGGPRRAGVSSFGIGGTNAHAVLEEAPEQVSDAAASGLTRTDQLLVLSARTPSALDASAARLADFLKQHPATNLADAAYTLGVGRREFEHRRALVCRDVAAAVAALERPERGTMRTSSDDSSTPSVVFMFAGQGAQHLSMARDLYEAEPTFREWVDRCAEILRAPLGLDLREVIYPPGVEAGAAARLEETRLAQPALFAIEYALAQLWISWGVHPAAMIGHSIGELTAACLAGVFSLEDALRLAAARGRLMQELPRGAMLVVPLPAREAEELLDERLSLAADNAPSLSVVSGSFEAVEELERRLAARGIACRRPHTSHAFHSEMMQPAIAPFVEEVKKARPRPPQLPYVSTLTGTWVTADEATDPAYWGEQLRRPVRFSEGVAELLKMPEALLLETGPGQTLMSLARQQPGAASRVVLNSLPHPRGQQSGAETLLKAAGALWSAGVRLDWQTFYAGQSRRRVSLPTYPFERRRFWIEPPGDESPRTAGRAELDRKPLLDDWFYVPSWKRAVTPELPETSARGERPPCWVVFDDGLGLGSQVAERLKRSGVDVHVVSAGPEFRRLGPQAYELNPKLGADYAALLGELRAAGRTPEKFLHLWNVTPANERADETRARGFDSLILLAQALGDGAAGAPVEIVCVTSNMQSVTGEEALTPEKATALGPCRVIPLEYQNIDCRSVDVLWPAADGDRAARLAERLAAECAAVSTDASVALRGTHRWVQTFEPHRLAAVEEGSASRRVREGGTYLLTGGLGEIDLAIAEHLFETARARVVFTGRQDIPARARQEEFLRALVERGAEVLVADGDVTNEDELRRVAAEARASFGEVNGIIHTAAVHGGGVVQLKTGAAASAVLAPKVRGTLLLAEVFKDEPLDFFVLFSNSLGLTGAAGQADYCAASAFLDAFAHGGARRETFTVAVDWYLPQWEDWGGPASGASGVGAEFAEARALYGISLHEGVEAFARVLGGMQPQVVVSTQDFPSLLERQREEGRAVLFKQLEATRAAGEGSVEGEVEQTVAAIWRQLFGVEEVGADDNFFDLGGNSLLAIQLVAQLRKAVRTELPLGSLFEAPTVAGLAARIREVQLKEQEAAEIERLLQEIESLSPEELQAGLAREVSPGDGNG